MNNLRRRTFAAVGVLVAAAFAPLRAIAAGWNKDAFQAKTAAEALKRLGIGAISESKDIVIEAPQIAENGAVVPIEITSRVPGTRSIAMVIEENPFPLAARFDFAEGTLPFIKVNMKINESGFVRAVVEAGGRYYASAKEVKVTIGGCGG